MWGASLIRNQEDVAALLKQVPALYLLLEWATAPTDAETLQPSDSV
jgi:hypothetical protein